MKETFYFTHDYNARSDEKIKRLIMKHGMAGYGVFWCIIEDLYNNANALRTDCELIAFELHTSEEIVRSIIYDFDLFQIENDFFGSSSVERRLNERNSKSTKARESALYRWNNIKNNANALRTDCDSNAIKEKKRKEKKIKENIITPNVVIEDEKIKDFLSIHFDQKYITTKAIQTIKTIKKKYDAKDIARAIEWGRGDPFWSKNFLSPSKLNQKDRSGVLYIDIFLENAKNQNQNQNGKSRNYQTAQRIDKTAFLADVSRRLFPNENKSSIPD